MKRFLPKSEFGRNVVTLMTGTVIAQAIPIAISPILTRLYSPEEFGLFALYMGLAAILSVIVTGRYEQAIMLPADDDDAANLVVLSLTITVIISLLTLLLIFFTSDKIASALEKPEIEAWLLLLPVTIFLTGIYQTLNYWNNRKKQYKTLAKNRIYQSTTMSIAHIGGGFISGSGIFLIFGDLIGKFTSASFLALNTFKKDSSSFIDIRKDKQISLAKRYKKFPIFDTGAALANVSSYQIQNILFPIFYGLSSAGFYFLVLRVLQAPLSLISTSLTDVYKQKLTDPKTTENDLKRYYKKMFVFLFSIGLPPLVLFMFIGEELFSFIFGSEWQVAGEYAIILAPMFYIRFIASPLSYFLYLKEKQEINVLGNFTFLICSLASVIFFKSAEDVVIFISVTFSLTYIAYIIYSFKLSKSNL
ncbi:lipopolysaccharide biosynthesis protein [Thiothrix lacustris]|uniref:lipopolysaccharide biosynthesis protein n=1 Tax=Thiothrix lacustris TaxID=525917 RepID=UPI00048E360B|nr:lipopolysaccharide biosynthesis protein [Thiothrix lacustris]